jgi:hypothetical protein
MDTANLSQEEKDTLTAELVNIKKGNTSKAKGSLKDFLKMKQQQNSESGTGSDKMQTE